MRHVISALVINEPGVLANVAGMFAARGFNIDSLVVGRTEDPELSRMTIVVNGDDNTLDQVRKQLAKLVPVAKVRDFKNAAYIERDLALISVAVGPEKRGEVIEIVTLFRGKVVDVAEAGLIVELAGTEDKIEAFVELLKPYGINELARTGVIAMARGMQIQRDAGVALAAAGGKRTRSFECAGVGGASAQLIPKARWRRLSHSFRAWATRQVLKYYVRVFLGRPLLAANNRPAPGGPVRRRTVAYSASNEFRVQGPRIRDDSDGIPRRELLHRLGKIVRKRANEDGSTEGGGLDHVAAVLARAQIHQRSAHEYDRRETVKAPKLAHRVSEHDRI